MKTILFMMLAATCALAAVTTTTESNLSPAQKAARQEWAARQTAVVNPRWQSYQEADALLRSLNPPLSITNSLRSVMAEFKTRMAAARGAKDQAALDALQSVINQLAFLRPDLPLDSKGVVIVPPQYVDAP